jgi:hypothetical protein
MDPASALPSYRIYRGSLLALLVGTVFAVWLLVRPGGTSDAAPPAALANVLPASTPTSTPAPAGAVTTPEPGGGTPTPAPEASPPPTGTPPTPTPSPTGTPRPTSYSIQSGDTLFVVAERFAPPGETPQQYVQRLYTANGLGPNSILFIGQTIQLPPPQ